MTHDLSDESFFLSQLREFKGNDAEYIDAIWKRRERDQDARNASIKSALALFAPSDPVKRSSKIDVARLPARLRVAGAER